MLQPRIVDVKPMDAYRLKLRYETGEVRLFDVKPYIRGTWYNELQNRSYFNAVRIIGGGFGIEWPNGQDLAPHELYGGGVLCAQEDPDLPGASPRLTSR